jgi:hypothetical protein
MSLYGLYNYQTIYAKIKLIRRKLTNTCKTKGFVNLAFLVNIQYFWFELFALPLTVCAQPSQCLKQVLHAYLLLSIMEYTKWQVHFFPTIQYANSSGIYSPNATYMYTGT